MLLVEDYEDSAVALYGHLKNEGATVEVAFSARQALAWLQRSEQLPAIILTDLRLPDVSGLEFKARLDTNPSWARIPVVAVTALASPNDFRQTMEAGFAAHVEKPVDLEQLFVTMSRVLRRTRRSGRVRSSFAGANGMSRESRSIGA